MPAASDEGLGLVVATVRYADWLRWMHTGANPKDDPYRGLAADVPVRDAMILADAYLKSVGKYPLEVTGT